MPRRPAPEVEDDPTLSIDPEEIARNDPPAPVERVGGDVVKGGVVQRVSGPPKPDAPAAAPAAAPPEPGPLDMEEIPGLPFAVAMERMLGGLVAHEGWGAVGDQGAPSFLTNGPRYYRLLRLAYRRGIYGDRLNREQIEPKNVKAMIG